MLNARQGHDVKCVVARIVNHVANKVRWAGGTWRPGTAEARQPGSVPSPACHSSRARSSGGHLDKIIYIKSSIFGSWNRSHNLSKLCLISYVSNESPTLLDWKYRPIFL